MYCTVDSNPSNSRLRKYIGDYIGMRFGNLVVIGYPCARDGIRRSGAICKCDCGETCAVRGMGDLFSGRVTSCRKCQKKNRSEAAKRRWRVNPPNIKRNEYGELCKERLYTVWVGMRNRCGKAKAYRDVIVCDEWQDYRVFREWAYSHGYDANAPKGKCTIDRINPFGNYEPTNCRFVDMKTQAKNKRSDWLKLDEEARALLLKEAAKS